MSAAIATSTPVDVTTPAAVTVAGAAGSPAVVAKKRARRALTYSTDRKAAAAAAAAKPKVQRFKKNGEAYKARRVNPGTLAKLQVKYYQKKSGSLLPRAPMVKMIREIVQDIEAKLGLKRINMDDKSKSMLIEWIENDLVRLLRGANKIAVKAAGRKTVFASDIDLFLELLGA